MIVWANGRFQLHLSTRCGSSAFTAFYFLPSIIALARSKRNTLSIFILNFFLGWTLVGWVIALV
jgi:hypothetical protein